MEGISHFYIFTGITFVIYFILLINMYLTIIIITIILDENNKKMSLNFARMSKVSGKLFVFIIIIIAIVYLVIHISSLIPGTSPIIVFFIVAFLAALLWEQWKTLTRKKN